MKFNWDRDFEGRAEHVPATNCSLLHQKVFYFRDEKERRMFYITLKPGEDPDLIQLFSLEITVDSHRRIKFLCLESLFNDTFEKLFIEIFQLMEAGQSLEQAYNKTLEKYDAFLRRELYLDKQKQLGLIGELWILKFLLNLGENSLDYWLDESEDFQVGKVFLEVKTTRSKEHKHTINGLAQLTVLPDTRKYLVSILAIDLGKEQTRDTANLYSLCNELLNMLPDQDRQPFLDKLSARGYHHRLTGVHYEQFNFVGYEKKIAEVGDEFPCLNMGSISLGLYANIDQAKIRYELNLSNKITEFHDLNSTVLKKIILNG